MLRSIVDELVVYRRPCTGVQTADRANAEIIGSLRHTRTADGKRGGRDIIPRKSYIARCIAHEILHLVLGRITIPIEDRVVAHACMRQTGRNLGTRVHFVGRIELDIIYRPACISFTLASRALEEEHDIIG